MLHVLTHSFATRLSSDHRNLNLRPRMTATAEIITSEEKNVLLVPNAALRFSRDKGSNARESSGVTSMIIPTRRRRSSGSREVGIGRGSQQTVYVLGADGQPKDRKSVV